MKKMNPMFMRKNSHKNILYGLFLHGENLDLKAKQCLTNVEQLGKTLHPGKAWHVKVPVAQGICHFPWDTQTR